MIEKIKIFSCFQFPDVRGPRNLELVLRLGSGYLDWFEFIIKILKIF